VKKILPLVAGALVLAMGLTGCSTNSQDNNKGGNTALGAAWDVNETPRDKVKDGGEFHGSFGSEIQTWNLNTSMGNNQEMKMMQSPLSEYWYLEDGSGNHTMNKNFLDSVTDEMVDGKLVITMKINQKATWNDGTPISADDWIATVAALNGEDEDFSVASSDGWDQIESVTQGETPQDVIVTFKEAFPDWINVIMNGPMRAESCKDADTFNDGWAEYNNAWYAGPYVVTNFVKSSNTVTMERNPNWWGDKGKLDTIIFKYVSDDQTATAFANGELDFIDIGPDPNRYAQAVGTPGTVIRQSGGPNYRHFTFNSASPVLSDVAVRQAIVMGLDRDAIAESDLAGLPINLEDARKNSNLYMQGQEGYVDLAEKTGIKYNPEGAKAKLEEAGYTMGADGYYAKDGQTLTVRFAVLTGVSTSENEGQLAQSQLKKIGVNIELQPINTATDWPGVLVKHNFDIIAFSWMGTAFPLANIGQLFGAGSASNYAQLTTDAVQELEPKVSTEIDPAKRMELAQQIDEALWTNVHTLPLYQRPALAGVRADLANIGSFGLAQIPLNWENVGYVA